MRRGNQRHVADVVPIQSQTRPLTRRAWISVIVTMATFSKETLTRLACYRLGFFAFCSATFCSPRGKSGSPFPSVGTRVLTGKTCLTSSGLQRGTGDFGG